VSFLAADQPLSIAQVLKQSGLTGSTSEALRMIEQGGVRIDGTRIDDKQLDLLGQGSFRAAGRKAEVCADQYCLILAAPDGSNAQGTLS
jgi:tyrosyl-tRNA synthetase